MEVNPISADIVVTEVSLYLCKIPKEELNYSVLSNKTCSIQSSSYNILSRSIGTLCLKQACGFQFVNIKEREKWVFLVNVI